MQFIHSRAPDYINLARADVAAFRREMLETLLCLGVAAAAALMFVCLLSVAAAGLMYSRRALSGPAPFANLGNALLHDVEIIEADSR